MSFVGIVTLACIIAPLVLLARNHTVRFPLYFIWAITTGLQTALSAGWV